MASAPGHPAFHSDDLGRRVCPASPAFRIVSLVPGLTEFLFAAGAGARVAGVTEYCNQPPEALALPRVGGVLDPDLERLRALRPDVVLASASENRKETVAALEAAGVPVWVTDPRTVDGALDSLERVSAALALGDGAVECTRRLRREFEALPPAPRLLPVFYPVWEDPLVSAGSGTFVADLLRRAGAVSAAEILGEGWVRCDAAFVAGCGAQAVLLSTEPFPYDEAHRARWLAMEELPACRAGRVHLVDGEKTNRPGPRMIEGIREVRRAIGL